MKEYVSDTLRILIPENLKIKQQAPQFFAEAKKPWFAIAVSIGDDDSTHKLSLKHLQRGPLAGDKEDVIVFENKCISGKCEGWEQISQLKDRETGRVFLGWIRAIKIRKDYNVYISIEGEADYKSSQEAWREIMDSIQIV